MLRPSLAFGRAVDGWYPRLFYPLMDLDRVLTLDYSVADVHTAPTDQAGNPVGWVVHAGTGNIDLDPLLRLMPNDGGDGWGLGANDKNGHSLQHGAHAGDQFAEIEHGVRVIREKEPPRPSTRGRGRRRLRRSAGRRGASGRGRGGTRGSSS